MRHSPEKLGIFILGSPMECSVVVCDTVGKQASSVFAAWHPWFCPVADATATGRPLEHARGSECLGP